MPDPQLLQVPLPSAEQCKAPSISDGEPPLNEDPVPDPDDEVDPPPGDPGPLTALIIATYEPPVPDTSSSPNPSPEDEPLVDQSATPSLEDQELASPDAEVETALAPIVAAAEVRSPPVASEITRDLAPVSPSGLSPESVSSLPPRTDIDRPWRNPKKMKKRQKKAK
ncbi:diacylglycerol kinase kappa [Macrobrachium rosenbergii]|uniref:diacylglycerol kinase kappa n=1 Tax=Macrobrachium rosenbergii TaxID=79674 RepID=UPI0034D6870B